MFVARCEDCKWIDATVTQSGKAEDVNRAMILLKDLANAHRQWYPTHKVNITTERK